MQNELLRHLRTELDAFDALEPISTAKHATDSYERVLNVVQKLMLTSDDPDAHARAWSLLNEDTYKYLSDFQEGDRNALTEMKQKMNKVGQLLLDT